MKITNKIYYKRIVNYINDISQYRDEYFQNLTNDPQRLLYIRTKTLTALRKLDHERKKQILLFLKRSSLLLEDDQSLLNGANFNGMIIEHNDCIFRNSLLPNQTFSPVDDIRIFAPHFLHGLFGQSMELGLTIVH